MWLKKIDRKFFWVTKNWVEIFFWVKKNLGQKNLGRKFFWVTKNWSEIFLGKIIRLKKF